MNVNLDSSWKKELENTFIEPYFLELVSFIKEASYIVSNDTGPAHISSHLNKKGLALFGSHTSAKKVSIEKPNFKALSVKNLSDLSAQTVIDEVKNNLN